MLKKIKTLLFVTLIAVFVVGLLALANPQTASADTKGYGKSFSNFLLGWARIPLNILWDGPKEQSVWSIPMAPVNALVGTADATKKTAYGLIGKEKDWPYEGLTTYDVMHQ